MMVVFLPGRKVTSRSSQISRIVMIHTGSAMKNQIPQPGWGSMFWRAIRFCGLAIGDAAPPILDARAMPRMSAFDMSLSLGRFLRIGWIILKHSTGAATLEIHIEANIATPMAVNSTVLGFVPAFERTKVAIILAMLYLLRAAAMVKPPSSNMMTGVHMAAKM